MGSASECEVRIAYLSGKRLIFERLLCLTRQFLTQLFESLAVAALLH